MVERSLTHQSEKIVKTAEKIVKKAEKIVTKTEPLVNNLDLTRQVLQKIREYMKAEKISMSEFARQTGVSKAWLSKLKHTDANLSLNTAQDLLHYMGYTLRLTREGGLKIDKSRMRKYAENLTSSKSTDFRVEDSIHSKSTDSRTESSVRLKNVGTGVEDSVRERIVNAEAGVTQISPTPGSTSATTQTTVVTPSPTPSATTPIKLNPGQSLTVSASGTKGSVRERTEASGVKDSACLQAKAQRAESSVHERITATKVEGSAHKQITASRTKTQGTENGNEFDLLRQEDFFTSIKMLRKNSH